MSKDSELEFIGKPVKKKYYAKTYMKTRKIEFGEYGVQATIYVPTGTEGNYSPKVWLAQRLGYKKMGIMFADVADMRLYLEKLLKFAEECAPNARKGLSKAREEYFDRVKMERDLKTGKAAIIDIETGEVRKLPGGGPKLVGNNPA